MPVGKEELGKEEMIKMSVDDERFRGADDEDDLIMHVSELCSALLAVMCPLLARYRQVDLPIWDTTRHFPVVSLSCPCLLRPLLSSSSLLHLVLLQVTLPSIINRSFIYIDLHEYQRV